MPSLTITTSIWENSIWTTYTPFSNITYFAGTIFTIPFSMFRAFDALSTNIIKSSSTNTFTININLIWTTLSWSINNLIIYTFLSIKCCSWLTNLTISINLMCTWSTNTYGSIPYRIFTTWWRFWFTLIWCTIESISSCTVSWTRIRWIRWIRAWSTSWSAFSSIPLCSWWA